MTTPAPDQSVITPAGAVSGIEVSQGQAEPYVPEAISVAESAPAEPPDVPDQPAALDPHPDAGTEPLADPVVSPPTSNESGFLVPGADTSAAVSYSVLKHIHQVIGDVLAEVERWIPQHHKDAAQVHVNAKLREYL
jgi:hypothetical protein